MTTLLDDALLDDGCDSVVALTVGDPARVGDDEHPDVASAGDKRDVAS